MASRLKISDQNKTSGSKRVCQERFSCSGSKAEFHCLDCGTRQCVECEGLLHASNSKFADHDRSRIQQVKFPENVQQCGMWCSPINPAEFSCIECQGVLCGECNKNVHWGKLTKHHRRPIPKKSTDSEVVNTEEVTSKVAPSINDKLETGLMFHDTFSEDLSSISKRYSSSTDEEFQSAIGLDSLSSLPVLEKLENPPDFNIHITGEQSSDYRLSSMDEISSNEFRSLEEALERSSIGQQLEERDLMDNQVDGSREPDTLSFSSGHFIPQESSVDTSLNPESKPKRPTATPRQRERITQAPAKQESSRQPFGMQPVSPKPVQTSTVKDTSARHVQSVVDHPRIGSNPKPKLVPVSLSSSGRESNLNKPIASVMGTSQNSISSNEGDSDHQVDSPRGGSFSSRKQMNIPGVLREDGGAVRNQIMVKEPTIKYSPGFLLVDENEFLQVQSTERFAELLGCPLSSLVKVVSIFGNTGDGKSHTLNHTFFGGQDIFRTSPAQDSCTIGIWAAYDTATNIIVTDTEGLQGISSNENQRTRLLLKVLAISDVVIYRTRADRLHRDLFQFLGDASKAYSRHFNLELKAASERGHLSGSLTSLGPAVIVFQETTHTVPLGGDQPSTGDSLTVSPDAILRERFKEYSHNIDAFSCVQYIGTQSVTPPTDFRGLRKAILAHVRNSSVRSPRPPAVVYSALKVLNDKFSGEIDATVPSTFPDEYFTCSSRCLSCDARCSCTMNHTKDNLIHFAEARCRYQHQYDNEVFTCKACYGRGEEVLVVPKTSSSGDTSWLGLVKYAWSGYVLECPNCGIIYRSRQHWYGNLDPEQTAVRTELRHVWPGGCTVLQGTHNAARRVVDGLSSVIQTVGSVSARPTQMVTQWMTDQIAPAYWRPNAEINECQMCSHPFDEGEKIHHCRACGEGFCDDCSAHQMPVPERGWGDKPVRVCEQCYMKKCQGGSSPDESLEQPVTARKMGEVVQSTFNVLGTAMQYPLGFMLDAARPAYWVPDSDIIICSCCQIEFTVKMSKHHCRACGKGVCSECSMNLRPVPSRGWDEAVRVCDNCDKKQRQL
ncbi:zinc finger FYVE domain-containing protein 1-like [Asterias amurensis]|uniref:zinc finger FYVE domain-containing protein 1-like n=1 Tax=Asterias amurensis TaxID=7602 RepID=UPI003AB2AA00